MRKSKLESYEDILEGLVNKPLTLDHLAYEINVDCTILRHHLDFLIKSGLVEERGSDRRMLQAITEKGIAVLKIMNFQKYLRKIMNKIRIIDDAIQVICKLEESKRRKEG